MKFKKREVADIIRDSILMEDGKAFGLFRGRYMDACRSFNLLNNFHFLEGLFRSSMSLSDKIIFTDRLNRAANHVCALLQHQDELIIQN